MRIAIIENEVDYARQLEGLLKDWSEGSSTLIEVTWFPSAEAYLELKNPLHNLVFMDIELGGMNGVTATQELRNRGFTGEVVFLTAFTDYVFQGYGVNALDYLLKPATQTTVARCMEYVQRRLHQGNYTFRHRGTIYQVPCSDILYFSSTGHSVEVVTLKERLTHREKLSKILQFLPKEFRFCHRTTIVNLDHIQQLKGRELLLTGGISLPVSGTYLEEIRGALLLEIGR